jgi:hypothetical protein
MDASGSRAVRVLGRRAFLAFPAAEIFNLLVRHVKPSLSGFLVPETFCTAVAGRCPVDDGLRAAANQAFASSE